MSYSNTTPVTLLQAQKAVELAERFKTDLVLPEAVKSAKSALAQATNLLTERARATRPVRTARGVPSSSPARR